MLLGANFGTYSEKEKYSRIGLAFPLQSQQTKK